MKCYKVLFQGNQAIKNGGVISANTESYFEIDSSEFNSNTADESSAIDVLGSSSKYAILIKNTLI